MMTEEGKEGAKNVGKDAGKGEGKDQKEGEAQPSTEGDKEVQQEKDAAAKNDISLNVNGSAEVDGSHLLENKVPEDEKALQWRGLVKGSMPPPPVPLPPRNQFMFPNRPPLPTDKPGEAQDKPGQEGQS